MQLRERRNPSAARQRGAGRAQRAFDSQNEVEQREKRHRRLHKSIWGKVTGKRKPRRRGCGNRDPELIQALVWGPEFPLSFLEAVHVYTRESRSPPPHYSPGPRSTPLKQLSIPLGPSQIKSLPRAPSQSSAKQRRDRLLRLHRKRSGLEPSPTRLRDSSAWPGMLSVGRGRKGKEGMK